MKLSKKKRSAIAGIVGGVITSDRIKINKLLLAEHINNDVYEQIQYIFIHMTGCVMKDLIAEIEGETP